MILCVPAESRELDNCVRAIRVWFTFLCAKTGRKPCCWSRANRLRRTEAYAIPKQAERRAAKSEHHATLGRYMMDMKHSVNNALTSILGNAELLLLEPGQLSAQSLAADQDHSQHGSAHQRNHAAILIARERDAGG